MGLAVVATNYFVDPGQLFGSGRYERRVARILLGGHNAAGVSNYDERLVQRYMAEAQSGPLEVLILGSSRTMQVRSTLFPGRRAYNAAVSGATLEDDIALYKLFARPSLRPRQVVLGLDPWLLNPALPRSPWAASTRTRLLQLVSPTYFQTSVRSLVAGWKEGARLQSIADEDTDAALKRADGSLRYELASLERPPATVRAMAIEFATAREVTALEGFHSIDTEAQARLSALLAVMRSGGAEVTLLLPPFHPDAYRRLVASPRYVMVAEAERVIARLAVEHGARVVGSFDPERAGCSDVEFFDAIHPRETCLARLLGPPPVGLGVR